MALSESSEHLRQLINKSIEDQIITPEEYEEIIHVSTEDGYIDLQERAHLAELQDKIENKVVRFGKKE